jgi:hypothetical protein
VRGHYRGNPILNDALAYWNRKRSGRVMPQRRDIDPTEIPHLLPHLQIIEVIEGGARFRYRLVGTRLVEAFGAEYTGKFTDEILSGDRASMVLRMYRSTCAARRPIYIWSTYSSPREVDLVAERIFLPLSEDGKEVNMILGAYTVTFANGARGEGWGATNLDPSSVYSETLDPDDLATE